jgi:uncharacterized protein YkwD
MKKSFFLIFILLLHWKALLAQDNAVKEAIEYLNKIRKNPAWYSKEIGVDLSTIQARPALQWNDTLARVAQAKAEDMLKRKYFDHTTPEGKGINILIYEAGYGIPKEWTEPASSNYFESIVAGVTTPKEGIVYLLKDKGEIDHRKAGHRSHLLGIDKFYANLTDIGIGWVKGGSLGSYLCVIIAKKK